MHRPRILHVITSLSTGGAQRALYNLLASGIADKFECAVVSLQDIGVFGKAISEIGIPVYALNFRQGIPMLCALAHLRDIVRRFRPDIVQGWMYHGNFAASLGAKLAAQSPSVMWNVRHSLYRLADEKRSTQWVIRAGRFLSSTPAKIIYNSQVSRQQHEVFGFSQRNSVVIPNGFDMTKWSPDGEIGMRKRLDLGIPTAAFVVGHVARFHPMKDHVTFLRAALNVAVLRPNVHFVLIGEKVDIRNPILSEILPAELLSRFHFLGNRKDVQDLMRAMDFFCQSSWSEAFPNVIGEAMAIGLPCVVTDVGDSAYVVGKAGIVVSPRNVNALTDAMLQLESMPIADLKVMGEIARTRVADHFCLPKIVDFYKETYDSVQFAN